VELTLNLVWLVISAVLLLLCGRRESASVAPRHRGLVVLALVCVICLLFPVISMTDDLNSSPALPEASKLKKIAVCSQIVVALVDRVVLCAPAESTRGAIALQLDLRAPSSEPMPFYLNRRPPPVSGQMFQS